METVTATVITAFVSSVVGAIVGALVAKLKTVRQNSEQAHKDAQDMKEMLRQNMLMTCRLTIYNDHFSVDEKLEAYVVYRDTCHANHQTKRYMDDLVGGDVDEYLLRHRIKE